MDGNSRPKALYHSKQLPSSVILCLCLRMIVDGGFNLVNPAKAFLTLI